MLLRYSLLIRTVSSLLALLLMFIIYHESSQPLGVDLNSFPFEDKLVHAVAYGVLAGLMLYAMKPSASGFTSRQQLVAALLATLYGVSDEWHQSFVPERTADLADILADAIGAVIAVYIAGMLVRRINWGQTEN